MRVSDLKTFSIKDALKNKQDVKDYLISVMQEGEAAEIERAVDVVLSLSRMKDLKLEWLLLSRMYYRSHNLHFDQWLVGLDINEKEFQNEVIPLLMSLAQSSKGGYELLEETLELIGEEEWNG